MKVLLVVLPAILALCASSAIPKDNSHYVEGVSRYVWIPDDDDVLQLVDLHAPVEPNTSRNKEIEYWLYTRNNPTQHQLLRDRDLNSVRNSNFNPQLPIVVIVHGWTGSGESKVNPYIRDAMLAIGNYNVIVMDWRKPASGLYTLAMRNVIATGEELAFFVDWLMFSFGGNWNNVHLIGYSLGAHVVGSAGRTVASRTARITGLDPSGPLFRGNGDALSMSDAAYVECIHTDGNNFGIFDPICQTNFYPNGGTDPQPGCDSSSCSHSRAYQLYAASVREDRFTARQCANLDEARNNRCNGGQLRMGNADLRKRGFGMFGLTTGASWPY